MKDDRRAVGRAGEDLAVEHLRKKGYVILDRNVRGRFGEIDIVAQEHGVVVFVEVRTMRSRAFAPEESIGQRKQRRLGALAYAYLQQANRMDAEEAAEKAARREQWDDPAGASG